MKSESNGTFEGIEFKINEYMPEGETAEGLDEFLADDRRIQQEMGDANRFADTRERPEMKIATYGPNEVILSYLCDDFTDWKGGKIINAPMVKDGRASIYLIEYFLNNCSSMSGTPLQRYQSFKDIPFGISESVYGRRTLNLITGATHPEIGWREMWNIFVAET
jgi:hypothetical protein